MDFLLTRSSWLRFRKTDVNLNLIYIIIADSNLSEMLVSMSTQTTLEEFYPAAAIATLMRIIRDPSLSQHSTMVVQAITLIFKVIALKKTLNSTFDNFEPLLILGALEFKSSLIKCLTSKPV